MTGTIDDLSIPGTHLSRLHAYALNPALLEDTMTPTNTKDAAALRKDAEVIDLQVRIRIGEVLLEAVRTPQQQRSQGWTEAVMVLTNCYCGLRGDLPR